MDDKAALRWREVTASGFVKVWAHDGSGAWSELDLPQHRGDPRGADLRTLRHALSLTLGQASRRLGITINEYSGLETGRAVCDWDVAEYMLREEW